MSVSKQSLMSQNPKKTRNKLKTGLNEIEFCWKKPRNTRKCRYSYIKFQLRCWDCEPWWSRGLDAGAESQSIFTSLGLNPSPRNYDFSPFPPLFSFFCHIQTFFYTNRGGIKIFKALARLASNLKFLLAKSEKNLPKSCLC
jgi:hypothetical protein